MDLRDAELLAASLLDEHELHEWTFVWSSAKRTFGSCRYRSQEIALSRPLTRINDEEHVRQTLLHEIAHALAGHGAGHGYAWKRVAWSIGCNGERCYSDEVERPPSKIVGDCECGFDHGRERMPKAGRVLVCRHCRGQITWRYRRQLVNPKQDWTIKRVQ